MNDNFYVVPDSELYAELSIFIGDNNIAPTAKFKVPADPEEIKNALIVILALQEQLKVVGSYINEVYMNSINYYNFYNGDDLKNGSASKIFMTLYRKSPVNDFDLLPITGETYLNSLPFGLGKIIRNLQNIDEAVIKKCIFEAKLAGVGDAALIYQDCVSPQWVNDFVKAGLNNENN